MSNSPNARVRNFIDKNGLDAESVLEAFNEADPLHCFYGNDVNPDEYVSVAERYLTHWQSNSVSDALDKTMAGYVIDETDRQKLIALLTEIDKWSKERRKVWGS